MRSLSVICAPVVCESDSDDSSSDIGDDVPDEKAVDLSHDVSTSALVGHLHRLVLASPSDIGVPAWAVDDVVADHWTNRGVVEVSRAAAPCIIWLQLAALSAIALQTSVYTLSRGQSSCVDGQVRMGTWWVWAPILPSMVFRSFVEWKAVRHLALPVARKGGSFAILGQELTFTAWLTVGAFLSGLNFIDLFKDSLWAARSERLLTCGVHGERLMELWGAVWVQSAPGLLGVPVPNLASTVTIFWFLALLQICVPLAKSLVACRRDVHMAHFAEVAVGFEHSLGTTYVKDVAFDLAEANGMVTLEKLQARLAQTMVERCHPDVGAQLLYVAPLGEMIAEKALLVWFLENAFQLNLQTTIFALAKRAAQEEEEDSLATEMMTPVFYYQTLIGIIIGILSTVYKLTEAWHFLEIGTPVARSAVAVVESAKPFDEQEDRNQEALRNYRKLRRAISMVRAGVCLLLLTLLYAVAKLIATHVCPDALLNITGCVVLDA